MKKIATTFSTKMLFFIFLIFSTSIYAGGWTPLATITNIQINGTTFYVQLDTNVATNINSCATWDGFFVIYDSANTLTDLEKVMVSTILAANSSGEKIRVYSSACNTLGFNNLYSIKLK